MNNEEEQQYERFDVDNDYEGGEYIGGEFFYQSRRQKRQQTEDDRIYGVFAEGSDSDEDRRARKRERADYTKPVAFISKGTVNKTPTEALEPIEVDAQPTSQQPPSDIEDSRPSFASLKTKPASKSPPPDDWGDRPATAGLGLGAAAAGAGLGAAARPGIGQPASKQARPVDEEDDEAAVLPTAFGARIKARAEKRLKEDLKQHKQEKQRKEATAADPHFAKFEQHTKGIGLKLLIQMGYKPGQGLGRDKSGIAKPIEVKLRPKNQGLGMGARHHLEPDEDEARPIKPQGPAAAPSVPSAPAKSWKKRNTDARAKREYKTAAQVLEASASRPTIMQPILDMRGPQTRVITNMEHLNVQDESAAGDKVPMPELQHNLQLLVDLGEADIQKIDGKLRHEQDSAQLLGRDKARLEDEVTQLELQLLRMTTVLEHVERCESRDGGAAPALSLSEIEGIYTQLSKEYREEYIMYNLATPALAHALPRLQALLQGWQPFQNPTLGVAEFTRWRALLDPRGTTSTTATAAAAALLAGGAAAVMDVAQQDPYTVLVSETVLPPVRSACTQWQPRDPEPLLKWLEKWEPLLPHAAMVHILDMLVMPALRRAVTEWQPRQETVPIHAWLHPWLPYLGPGLEELYPVIRGKLSMALQMWHPSDTSALVLLSPWRKVFSPADWDALVLSSIVPKLAQALLGFQVNPAAQDMTAFNWVMAWKDVLSPQHMASVLESGFFPQWHQVLHYWLSHQPNYDEVTRWYRDWKDAFPPALFDHERIRQQFITALNMMNSAVDGQAAPLPPQGAYAGRWAAEPEAPQAQPAAAAAAAVAAAAAATELTLKELVQRFAAENGIQFMPKFGRFQDGLQVYAFGSTSIILDNTHSSIKAFVNGKWVPATLEGLLQSNLR